ncbi:MAG: hypothetical protein STSR0008_12600 [Ignavibacterium sp.]
MKKELLIFGSSGSVGKKAVKIFSQKNYDSIYLFQRNENDINTNNKIKLNIVKDLTIEENVSNAFSIIEPGQDKLLFLFSTIGTFIGGKLFWNTGFDNLKKILDINLNSNFLILKYFAQKVEKSVGGSACFISGYSSIEPMENSSIYGISKAALNYLIKTSAFEGRRINLSVNAIAPYTIDTEENRKWIHKNKLDSLIKPEEIINIAESCFENFQSVSGNIITLKERIKI